MSEIDIIEIKHYDSYKMPYLPWQNQQKVRKILEERKGNYVKTIIRKSLALLLSITMMLTSIDFSAYAESRKEAVSDYRSVG